MSLTTRQSVRNLLVGFVVVGAIGCLATWLYLYVDRQRTYNFDTFKNDTTITIHNGIYDTVIIRKK